MSVQESINRWGAAKLGVPEGTHITLTEELPSADYCETCGPDPVTVTIEGGGKQTVEYMSMGEVVQEILALDAEQLRGNARPNGENDA